VRLGLQFFAFGVTLLIGSSSNTLAKKEIVSTEITSIETLNKNPQAYIGKRVTLIGEVEKVYNQNLFKLDGPGILNDELLVIIRRSSKVIQSSEELAGSKGITEDSEVQVTGTVEQMEIVDIIRDYDFDLDSELEVELDKTMLVLISEAKDVIRLDY